MKPTPMTEADLHAYVDGLLPEARRVEVENYLAARPEEAARVHSYREQNRALHALFDPVLDEPAPERLRNLAQRRSRPAGRYAAVIAWLFIGGVTGWLLRGEMPPPGSRMNDAPASGQLAHRAAIAHVVYSPEVLRPVEIGADQEDQLVKWLSKRLGSPLRPPKLAAVGFELIGGRLLPGNEGPVAQFMYHDTNGQRLTLYVSTENTTSRDTAFRFIQEGPVNVFYWIDGKFGYALSGGMDKQQLLQIAQAVYQQLNS